MYLTDDIIDVEGNEIESIPIHEGDEVEMGSNNAEEMRNEGGWTKAPESYEETEPKKRSKVLKREENVSLGKKGRRRFRKLYKVAGIGLVAFLLVNAYKDKFANWFKDFRNDLTKTNNEETITEVADYDVALAEVGAIVKEPEEKEEAPQVESEPQQLEEGASDNVIGGKVLAFTDPYDDDQVYARAEAIYVYLQKSNVKDVTVDELCDQIKFVNGTYNAATDDEAWDVYDDFLQTIADYSVATEQSNNFAGGVVDDNGVHAALGLDAFLSDNCEHREIIDEIATKFINLLNADTMERKINASKKMLKLEVELKEGMKETPDGTRVYFTSLTSSEGMIVGLMFQLSNAIIHSSLGENVEITYKDNMGQDNKVTLNFLETYYNPQCNEEYDTENVWAKCCIDLVETAIAKGLDSTSSR